jgi:hypothetical protein
MPSEPTICTYCSAQKDLSTQLLPAVRRYLSERISRLHQAGPMLILSGEFGLISAEEPIPWYDHLLLTDEVDPMVAQVVAQLRQHHVSGISFHTADPEHVPAVRPYVTLITRACAQADVPLSLVILPGNPS